MKGENHPCFGKKFTKEETQKRLDRYKNNPETRAKISNSLIEHYKNNKNNKHINKKLNKKVEQYDLNGKLINEFYSISEAARSVNINVSFLSRTCNKENYTAAGFIWKKY